jgi:ferredoxin/flavodoxin---NADP+ reductase
MRVSESYYVAVVGAGPAGMFAAREMARAGAQVVIFNRDIKPGGLAEYGIYPDKHAMKHGLRTQFQQILDTPGIKYYGNISIGAQADLNLDDLRACGFQAVLVAAGAQGTKWLGLPGENLIGVYHAKDLVYHYNQLPPYSQKKFVFGKKAAVVGAGNVMLDIARFLMQKAKVEEVVAIVRRGPVEVKFDKKEMEYIISQLDLRSLDEEIERVSSQMKAIGQDPQAAKANILEALPKAYPPVSLSHFRFEFLASPTGMRSDGSGAVSSIDLEDNLLALKDGEVKARGTGNSRAMAVDSVVFAIGDRVDDTFGLPVQGTEFAKNPSPRFPVDGNSYEAYDPQTESVIPDVFVAGWSRQASTGLVGYARKDGTNGSKAIVQYLQTLQPITVDNNLLEARLKQLGKPLVTRNDIRNLHVIEQYEAHKLGVETFKFNSNEEMLEAIMSVG